MIILSYFSKIPIKHWVLCSAPTSHKGDSRRSQKALEIPGSWDVGKRRDSNALLSTKCNPSTNSSSHKALRYKTSGRHANEGLQSWRTRRAACPRPSVVVSAAEEQQRFPVVPGSVFLNHLIQGLGKILSEFLSNIQEINFTS